MNEEDVVNAIDILRSTGRDEAADAVKRTWDLRDFPMSVTRTGQDRTAMATDYVRLVLAETRVA